MTISDALPIQFWYNGIPTYNEYDPGQPFDHILFFQEFLTTDDQIVQLRDTTGLNYYLQFLDCDGIETNLLPFVEISTGIYQITFNPGDLGIVNVKRQLKIQNGVVIGTITTESQVSIDEFTSTMDGWVNESNPTATLAALSTFLNHNNEITPGGLGDAWSNVSGFPYVELSGGGSVSKWSYIDLSGSNDYTYTIQFKVNFNSTSPPATAFTLQFIYLDSIFNPLDASTFVYSTSSAPGNKTGTFTIPSGIGPVKYVALKVILTAATTGILSFTWVEANLIVPPVADWAWSADDSGCIKVTTVATNDTSIVKKSVTLPQENHYIRVKWQIVSPPANTNFTIVFRILNASNSVLFVQILTSPSDSSEQTFNQFITSTVYLTAAFLRIDIYDSTGVFVAGDIAKVNSVEIYTTVVENVVSFIEMAKSDYLQFSNIVENAIYIQYKSLKNFASIYYTSSSPYFGIRIPAIFQKQKPITEQKAIDLSNSVVINTASQLKIQKMLKTEDLPDYEHTKIILILQHAISGSVIINNVEWTNEQGYEVESPNEFYILNRGSILLTRKNYLESNVI